MVGSWIGLSLCVLILVAQFYVALYPPTANGLGTVTQALQAILALPIVLIFWGFGFLWKRTGWLTIDNIDLDTGLREHDWEEINAYRAKVASWPAWRRVLHHIF